MMRAFFHHGFGERVAACALLVAACLSGRLAVADTTAMPLQKLEGLAAECRAPLGTANVSGFDPMLWKVENARLGPMRMELEVGFELPQINHQSGSKGFSSSYDWTVDSTVSAAPAEWKKVLLPVSVLSERSFGVGLETEMRVGGLHAQTHLSRPPFGGAHIGGIFTMPVAFSASLHLDGAQAQKAFESSAVGPHAAHDALFFRFQKEIPARHRALRGTTFQGLDDFPADARSFFGLAGLWLDESEWKRSSAPMQEAVLEWVRSGGRLYLTRPEGGAQTLEPLMGIESRDVNQSREWGLGRILRQGAWKAADSGRLKADVLDLDKSPFPPLAADYAGWTSALTAPVQANLVWLLLFLFGFAVLAAPVNLYLIAPKQRRHRLFVTVPLLSLCAVILLVGFILASEGTGGTGIRNGLLLLEPGAASSILYQEQSSRTGIIAQSGFPLPEDAVFMWVRAQHSDGHSSTLLRNGAEASGGWFLSRAVQAHLLQRWIPSRAAVVVKQGAGGNPTLVSTVNHRMGPVFFVDDSGGHWKVGELLPGSPATTEKTSKQDFESWYAGVFQEPSSNLKARAEHARGRSGWFYAKAQEAPDFWIPTSPKIRWVRDEMLCCGPVKAPVLNPSAEVR